MQNQRCEILITFMYEEINRFLAYPTISIRMISCLERISGGKYWAF